jgi:hypothetical protein
MTPPPDDDATTGTTPAESNPTSTREGDDPATPGDPSTPDVPEVPGVLDWILGGLVALGGLLFALAGGLVYSLADREQIEALVAPDDVQIEGMTKPEFVDLTVAVLPWVAAGLVVTGLAMLVLGVAYVVHRRRVHRREAAGESVSHYPAHALVGAAVSTVTSFIPFSPLVGGGVAGYLERGDSTRTASVGAASGAVMSAPFFLPALFVAAGVAAGFGAIGEVGGGVAAAIVVVGALASLAFTVILGAIGGWIGGKLAER